MKSHALSLAFMMRFTATRKWPVSGVFRSPNQEISVNKLALQIYQS